MMDIVGTMDRSPVSNDTTATDVFIHSRFESEYRRHPLVLVDVGARGGLRDNWAAARRNLQVLGFEPDQREFDQLAAKNGMQETTAYFGVALHNRPGPIRLNVARDRGLSSIFVPNRAFIDAFPDATRFDTIDVQQVEADTLDNLLRARAIHDVDFLKVDTQGSELFVLEGAASALASTVTGVEVEVEFTPIYQGQPLFADVDAFLRERGYLLFDLRPCYWKRAAGRAIGGPRGQIDLGGRTLPEVSARAARHSLGTRIRRPEKQGAPSLVRRAPVRLPRLRPRDRARRGGALA